MAEATGGLAERHAAAEPGGRCGVSAVVGTDQRQADRFERGATTAPSSTGLGVNPSSSETRMFVFGDALFGDPLGEHVDEDGGIGTTSRTSLWLGSSKEMSASVTWRRPHPEAGRSSDPRRIITTSDGLSPTSYATAVITR